MIPVPRGPRGRNFQENEIAHRRDVLTTSSPCPFCRRRCLAHSGQKWECRACGERWTGHKIPAVTDRFAGVRALVARAKTTVYAVGERTRKEVRL